MHTCMLKYNSTTKNILTTEILANQCHFVKAGSLWQDRYITHPSFVKIGPAVSEILRVTNIRTNKDRSIVPLRISL